MAKTKQQTSTEFIEADGLDLSPEGLERARIFHEISPNTWIRLTRAYATQRQAEAVAQRWKEAKATSFGGTHERFDAQVVKLVPADWWKAAKTPNVKYGVKVCMKTEATPEEQAAQKAGEAWGHDNLSTPGL